MAEFNYKQIIYAGMVAIAGVDGNVDKVERKLVDTVFEHDFNMSKSEKKDVLQKWEATKESFTDTLISELSEFPKFDQREAFKRISQFILFKSNMYNKSSKRFGKGIDPEKEQINRYRERAEVIRKGLSF